MAKDETKQRIVTAARDCFAQLGWAATTTQEIARVAGVNEVTLFRHFGSKSQLFAAMVSCYMDAQKDVLSQTMEQNATLSEGLASYAKVYFQTIGGSPDYVRTMLGEMTRHPVEVRQVVIDMMRPLRQQFMEFLSNCQKRGEIRSNANCEAIMDAFMGQLFANIIKPRFNDPTYTQEEFIRFVVDLFVKGLRP
jgi:AcrR family transcriptional regulator